MALSLGTSYFLPLRLRDWLRDENRLLRLDKALRMLMDWEETKFLTDCLRVLLAVDVVLQVLDGRRLVVDVVLLMLLVLLVDIALLVLDVMLTLLEPNPTLKSS